MLPPGIGQGLPPSSPSTGVYNPKAFILHAASLGQACAHCRRFSTAASRRSLGSVSVPVCRAALARPVGIIGLVGRYPANDLIPRRPVPRRRNFGPRRMPDADIAGDYPQFPAAIPNHGVGYRRLTHPCATGPIWTGPVRLACLIHAANVHSEPGSNPSQMSRSPAIGPLATARPPAPGPHPKGLRKKLVAPSLSSMTVATDDRSPGRPREAPELTAIRPTDPRRTCAGPCEPSRQPDALWTHRAGCPHDHSHAGFPQGFIDATNILSRLVVFG